VARTLRDRTALFFMVLLPVAIIVVIGVTVSGFDQFRVGLVPAAQAGPVAQELTSGLKEAPGLRTHTFATAADARTALRRAELDAVVVVPPGLDKDVRAGRSVTVRVLVGTGAGVLAGALFRTPEQVHAIGPALGIGLGMLGGCMWPLALVPDWLRTAGHAVPHAWAVDAWTTLLSRNGDLSSILRDLVVLAAFATALLTLASLALRRRLTTTPEA